jgi:N-acetylglutamate synthase-like GNAT family acetyltransferase
MAMTMENTSGAGAAQAGPISRVADRVVLRVATIEDVPALRQLIAESVRGLQSAEYTQAQIDGALGTIYGTDQTMIADGTFFVVEDGSTVVACGGWSFRRTAFGSDDSPVKDDSPLDPLTVPAKIRGFFVHPSWARQGLATRILLASEDAARNAGFTYFQLVSTLTGVPLYQRHGYAEVERVTLTLPNGEQYPAVRMEKR